MANTGSDWFVGNAAFFVKIGKSESGMTPELCLFVVGGKEMLLYLIGDREQSQDLLFVFVRVTPTQQEVHGTQRTQDIYFQNDDY